MFDFSMVRGRIVEKFKTLGAFATVIGRTNAFVSNVMNGKSYLTQADIDEWANALEIPSDLIGAYFFTKRS